MTQLTYIGTELELFARAKNWKNYLRSILKKYIKGSVLEVGAGIGSNTKLLQYCQYDCWFCLEPDPELFQVLKDSINLQDLANFKARNGTIDDLDESQLFDSILYLDVLEHIEADRRELIETSKHLEIGGNLIILSPAHQWLFSPFDRAIGHYRRYNKRSLQAVVPKDIKILKIAYLDSVGLIVSLANKLLLKQSRPSLKQIQLWDNLMIPASRKIDPLLGYQVGKSILLVGKKF